MSAASVATAKLLGPELPSASLFEGTPEETLPETYGPGKPEEADDETMDEGVMDVTNAIFEEEQEDVVGSEEEQEDIDGAEEEQEVDGTEEEEEHEVDGAEEEQEDLGAEVEDAALVIQAFGVTSLVGLGKYFFFWMHPSFGFEFIFVTFFDFILIS